MASHGFTFVIERDSAGTSVVSGSPLPSGVFILKNAASGFLTSGGTTSRGLVLVLMCSLHLFHVKFNTIL